MNFAGLTPTTPTRVTRSGLRRGLTYAVGSSPAGSSALYLMLGYYLGTPESWTAAAPASGGAIINPVTGHTVTGVSHLKLA